MDITWVDIVVSILLAIGASYLGLAGWILYKLWKEGESWDE
jgi:hypothetical protein